jgi:hypothetical protein
MDCETTSIVQTALIDLSFAKAELALCDRTPGADRALEHLELAINDLLCVAANFGRLDDEAA